MITNINHLNDGFIITYKKEIIDVIEERELHIKPLHKYPTKEYYVRSHTIFIKYKDTNETKLSSITTIILTGNGFEISIVKPYDIKYIYLEGKPPNPIKSNENNYASTEDVMKAYKEVEQDYYDLFKRLTNT